MDKETLSRYGWVVIVIIIIAILLGFSYPMALFTKDAFFNTTTGLGEKIDEVLDVDPEDESENIIMNFMENNMRTRLTGPLNTNSFAIWASGITKVVFEDDYNESEFQKFIVNVDQDTFAELEGSQDLPADKKIALDVSEDTGSRKVIAYLRTEGEDLVLHIAGKNGVVVANENSGYIFAFLPYLKTINFNNSYKTSNAKIFTRFASKCSSLSEIDLSSFNTANATDMAHMFSACESLTKINLSSFDTSKVTDMSYMFGSCASLTELDISSFETAQDVDLEYMFESCSSLEHIYVGDKWDVSKASSTDDMFYRCLVSTTEKKS